MEDYSFFSVSDLADLLSEKTFIYHSLMTDHLQGASADLNHLALLKGEIKKIQAEINKRYSGKILGK